MYYIMINKKSIETNFRCNICNKFFASKSSIGHHNKKFHSIMVNESKPLVNESKPLANVCKYCNKILSCKQSKSRHQKICSENNLNNDTKFDDFKNNILELLKQNAKIHPKTLQKINKQLINNTNTTNNNNTHNNTTNNINNQTNTINNGPVINNTFVKFGHEHLSLLLTNKQMYRIVNSCCTSIEESIKTVHFNKNLPEYSNIFITNLRDSTAYIFDGIKFISVSKDEVIGELLQNHKNNIEEFMETAKLPEFKYKRIMKFLEAINDVDEVFVDVNSNNRRFTNYQAYKLNIIKHLIYNNSDSKLLKKLNNLELEEKIIEYPDTESSNN